MKKDASILFVVLMGIAFSIGCNARYKVIGTVTRCDTRDVIGGAMVTLGFHESYKGDHEGDKTLTDNNGEFKLSANAADRDGPEEGAILTISADGFDTSKRTVQHTLEGQSICLYPAGEAPQEEEPQKEQEAESQEAAESERETESQEETAPEKESEPVKEAAPPKASEPESKPLPDPTLKPIS